VLYIASSGRIPRRWLRERATVLPSQVLFSKDTGKDVAVHNIGIHAADLIQECANAFTAGTAVQELSMMVHTRSTLSEVIDEAFKGAVGMSIH
jgi:dihydrolipoamide dehydrogenase